MALFDDFPATSTSAWEERIRKDLGEADYGEVMLWHTDDDFTLRAYYRSEDLEDVERLRADLPSSSVPRPWIIRQDVSTHALTDAKNHIRQALDGGIEMLGLRMAVEGEHLTGVNIQTQDDLAYLLEGVPLDGISFHLDAGLHSPALAAMLVNLTKAAPRITLGFDPVGDAMRTGTLSEAAVSLARDLVQERRGFRPLSIDAGVFHEAGATTVQETAFLLASLAEHLVLLVDKGAHISDAITGMHVSLHISSSYFREIARIRALRMLLPLVEQGFTSEQSAGPMPIHAVTSRRNMAALDPHMNLLRTTTEAASAAIGGADVIAVRPFDAATRSGDDFSYRLARNVQLVLRHEAHLDKVGDPAAGSYYLEILTDVIARRAWQLFKEVEGRGGLLRMMETGELQRMIIERQSMRWNDLATGRRVLVGVNRYLDPVETMPEDPPYSPLRRTDSAEPVDPIFERLSEAAATGRFIADLDVGADRRRIGPPLESIREAEAIEELRLADPEADPGELASRLQPRLTTS